VDGACMGGRKTKARQRSGSGEEAGS